MPLEPGLYVTATPIGNLKDVTFRALEVLGEADAIACEDTRTTARLLSAHGLKTTLVPYHDHNAEAARPKLLARIAAGEAVALVSDAGTPLISDPGYKLVREARERGFKVVAIPGASALTAALSIAGTPTDRVLFAGFPPARAGARAAFFKELAGVQATLVFYEGPSRLGASLAAMAAAFGDRRAVVARELTKMYEETVGGALSELAARYAEAPPKGEIVVLVEPPAENAGAVDLDAALRAAMAEMSLKDAAAAAAEAAGVPRRTAYARALQLKGGV
ncbi:MAG: 16S rRNA (cytidine(1402)-2'-O)-methyltransferase [Pseudomonadota bacterium]